MAEPANINPQVATPSLREVEDLVVKHHAEIDRIRSLNSQGQMEAMAALGIDPKAVMEHYKDLSVKSEELMRQDRVAARHSKIMGWTTMALATGGAIAMGKKLGSWVIRLFVVPVVALSSGFLGTYVGSRIFSGKIREESRKLDMEARNALERELAVGIENAQRSGVSAEALLTAATPPASPAVSVAPRDASFAAQAAVEKTVAAQAPAQRA